MFHLFLARTLNFTMLRRGKFKVYETAIVAIFAILLFGVGLTGLTLALTRGQLPLALASLGAIAIGSLYLFAALRRRPL